MSRMMTRADEKHAFYLVKNDYEDSLINLLSEKNINLNDKNDVGNLLEYAIKSNNYNVSAILMEFGADPKIYHSCLLVALSNYNLELFISLLENGANPNATYRNGTSLMKMIITFQKVNYYQNYFDFAMALVKAPNFQLEARLIDELIELDWFSPIWRAHLRRIFGTDFE